MQISTENWYFEGKFQFFQVNFNKNRHFRENICLFKEISTKNWLAGGNSQFFKQSSTKNWHLRENFWFSCKFNWRIEDFAQISWISIGWWLVRRNFRKLYKCFPLRPISGGNLYIFFTFSVICPYFFPNFAEFPGGHSPLPPTPLRPC